ncbi:hypothetical protein BGZ94_000796 [Podila epigama]|nr:hypothetical protein BGZ94_000796 [Podila epigama]
MPPITSDATLLTSDSTPPPIAWSVHILAPYALLKDIDTAKDDIDHDDSYFVTTTMDGQKMVTEWNPELRLGIHKAVSTIPNVVQQTWHYIGLDSVDRILNDIQGSEAVLHAKETSHHYFHPNSSTLQTVVLNFTDGMETDGWPGISIIHGLEVRSLAFTGADSVLYKLDSNKALIKRHLVDSGTPTPGYYDIYTTADQIADEAKEKQQQQQQQQKQQETHDSATSTTTAAQTQSCKKDIPQEQRATILKALSKLKFPLLVKPANSSSSRGISTKSVVDTPTEALERALETKRVWGPVYVEEYITGREYTALVSGSERTGIHVYKVLERVFRDKIPERERMLTHEMKWGENNYGADGSVQTASWWMHICDEPDQSRLQQQAKEIYMSFQGNGYCRMDLREDHRTGKVYVVDVNANCSIDESEDCAMGKILKSSGLTLGQFFEVLMKDAVKVRNDRVAQLTHDKRNPDKKVPY